MFFSQFPRTTKEFVPNSGSWLILGVKWYDMIWYILFLLQHTLQKWGVWGWKLSNGYYILIKFKFMKREVEIETQGEAVAKGAWHAKKAGTQTP